MKRRERILWGILSGLLPLSLALIMLARRFPDQVERVYSTGFYPLWAGLLAGLTSWLPFSLAELMIIFGSLAAITFLILAVHKTVKSRGSRLRVAGVFGVRALGVLSLILFLFTLGGGLNYYRYSFTHYSGLAVEDSPIDQLKALCLELGTEASDLRAGLADDDGVFVLSAGSAVALGKTAQGHYKSLMGENPQWAEILQMGARTRAKGVFFSEAMSYMQIVGVFFPFTMEANVNTHTSPMDIPAAICHELAHVSGFMREDEANYIAYLACMAGESDEFRYSGTMLAFVHASNALYGKNKEMYGEVMESLSDAVRRDLAADSAYYYSHKSSFGEFSNSVNDVYLRINDQDDGVDSYGRMVDLLLAGFRQRHGL